MVIGSSIVGGVGTGWAMRSGSEPVSANDWMFASTAGGSVQSLLGGPAPVMVTGGGAVGTPAATTEQAQIGALASQIGATINALVQQLQRQQQYAPFASRTTEDGVLEADVLKLVNAERAKEGLKPLTYSGVLDAAAEAHNDQQRAVGAMAHEGIGDGTPGSRVNLAGWKQAWGENVAVGQATAAQVVREWMASPTHRSNIMDPNFTKLGVAYATDAGGRPFWAQSFGA
ncbi:MAG: SCP-like extracellular [Thermoleophilia bacterium]|jgi:uncharacterized protein YkwD|nr:SCP-like extracellular [Thermoleophilia bacterium]